MKKIFLGGMIITTMLVACKKDPNNDESQYKLLDIVLRYLLWVRL